MGFSFDLVVRAGRVVCPAGGLDAPGAVAVRDGRIVAAGADAAGPARQVLDFPDAILLPGLIDLHAHPAGAASQWGVDPATHLLARGTTTVLSQGDAGAAGCEDYVREIIGASPMQVLLAINLSAIGEAGPGPSFARIDDADVAACVRAIRRFPKHIWGLAVNAGHPSCGATDPREVLRRGLDAARQTGRPILYGMRRPEDWPLAEQLRLLRPGDVVTYCYRRTPHCIAAGGRVLDCVRAARERGVRFDVGHGMGSFDFAVAEAALRDGFPPDTISTDLQRGHAGRHPVHDLPLVMSKLRAAGMPERDVFAAVTATPAAILGRADEIGSLRPGSRADLMLLRWTEHGGPLADVAGNTRPGGRWQAVAAVCGGQPVEVRQDRPGELI